MVRTVLIVEDSRNVAENLELVLTTIDGISVIILESGQDALKFLVSGTSEIAALVTDLNLPFTDGFALIEAVRGNQRYSRLPIVVISGDSHPETPARLRSLGADAYFSKPYSPAEIKRTLEGLLNAH
jgi:DNA-binding response OmpR family regulator